MKNTPLGYFSLLALAFLSFAPLASAQGNLKPSMDEIRMKLYGDLALDAGILEEELQVSRNGSRRPDIGRVLAAKARIVAGFELPTSSGTRAESRVQMSRTWMLMAELTSSLEGQTPQVLEELEVALSLDPDNEELAQEVAVQRSRQKIVSSRLAEASRIRGEGLGKEGKR